MADETDQLRKAIENECFAVLGDDPRLARQIAKRTTAVAVEHQERRDTERLAELRDALDAYDNAPTIVIDGVPLARTAPELVAAARRAVSQETTTDG